MLEVDEACHLPHTLCRQIQSLIHEKYWEFINMGTTAFYYDIPYIFTFIIIGVYTP